MMMNPVTSLFLSALVAVGVVITLPSSSVGAVTATTAAATTAVDNNKNNVGLLRSTTRSSSSSRSRAMQSTKPIPDAICDMGEQYSQVCEKISFTKSSNPELYDQLLSVENSYTVFVPSNAAWNRLQASGSLAELTTAELDRIFWFHFYEGMSLTYDALECGETLQAVTYYAHHDTGMDKEDDTSRTQCDKGHGDDIKHQNGNGNTKLGNLPTIGVGDVVASNGILHTLDDVMLPVFLEGFSPIQSNPFGMRGAPPQYEDTGYGCIPFAQGYTDDQCRGAVGFDGTRYQYTYKALEGPTATATASHACCQNVDSEVVDGYERNYVEDWWHCIPYQAGTSDAACQDTTQHSFGGFDYSYTCTEGERQACCRTNIEATLSNVQDLGDCTRTSPLPDTSSTVSPTPDPYPVIDDVGCVAYSEADQGTDADCIAAATATDPTLFDGNTYKFSYTCTEGVKGMCCEAGSNEYESNVFNLGECTRNYNDAEPYRKKRTTATVLVHDSHDDGKM